MPVIYAVGTGPGGADTVTPQAMEVLRSCDVIVGYSKYVDMVKDLVPGKILYSSGMTHEAERCRAALRFAVDEGKNTFSTEVINVISEKANIIITTAIVINLLRRQNSRNPL